MSVCQAEAAAPDLRSGSLREVIQALPAAAADRAVLVLVLEAQGSTYRKPGAVLLRGGEAAVGWLSGGCLEAELDLVAAQVLAHDRARVHAFDTHGDDDLLFGSASGCRGAVTLLLLPVHGAHPLVAALQALGEAHGMLELTLGEDGAGSARIDAQAWAWPAPAPGGARQWTLRLPPPPRLLLLGVGPEAAPLIRHARALGWQVDAVEHRGRWRSHARDADRLVDAPPEAAWAQLDPARYRAAVVMSHHYAHDLVHLQHLQPSRIGYVGLLGPPARRDALLTALGAAASSLIPRLHAPVGLRLGGEGPAAIALGILAELQRHLTEPAA